MKIHFASAFPWQCFYRGWQDFILRASVFTWATSAKTLTRSKLVKLPPLLHISPRIIMCSIMWELDCAITQVTSCQSKTNKTVHTAIQVRLIWIYTLQVAIACILTL